MFLEQMKWSLWFIVFVLVSYIVVIAISINTGSNSSDFFGFSYGSTKVYMLVIGIISASAFLTFYVKHGVTRKDYFIGSILAIIFLSITLTRSEEHTSELQSRGHLVCRLLLEKK